MTVRTINPASQVEAAAPAYPGWRTVVRVIPVPLIEAAFIAGVLDLLLHGWSRDFRVPFGFSSDSLWYLMQSKSTVENGWWWWNARIGAPFGLDALAYPSNSNLDQAVLWLVARFVSHPFAAINFTWCLLVVLSGLTATWCLEAVGMFRLGAVVAGTLFALSPYALYRNVEHFSLVIYLVPFACAVALQLAAGRPHQTWRWTSRLGILGGCVLLGFDYVYYAFFGCFCIAAGMVVGFAAHGDKRLLQSAALCIALVSTATLANLAPSLYSWHTNGRPMVLRDKVPAEAETFGLKIRQLVSPVYPNHIPTLQSWVEREAAARFPNENENWTSRLGLISTVGFLGLLALLFIPDRAPTDAMALVRGASRVTLAILLLATVGGFGSLFNLFVAADIRAYNRVVPFITFFSLVAVMIAIERLVRTPRARVVAALVVLVIGLTDQGQAARRLNDRYGPIAAEVAGLDTAIRTLQLALPRGAMVFQLPFRAYMSESTFGRMQQYDHFKPYLVSETLRFSYPALSNEQVRWQQAAARLDPASLAARLASARFSAVLIDRYGYQDEGTAIVSALKRVVGEDRTIPMSDRFIALDIRAVSPHGDAPGARIDDVALTLSLPPCAGAPLITIDQIGTSRAPFGVDGVVVPASSSVKISGWALDHLHRSPATGVDVALDRSLIPATYGLVRPDVAAYFQRRGYEESGFIAVVPASSLPAGEHWLGLRVVSFDGSCYYQASSIRVTAGP
jgi:hypothetical protein